MDQRRGRPRRGGGRQPPRAVRAIRTIGRDAAEQGWRKVAVVAHGGLFMGLLAQYGRPDRSYYDWLLPNCGGYRVTLETDPLELLVTGTVGQVREENRPII